MPDSNQQYANLLKSCQQYDATLLVVSKTRTKAEMEVLYQMGQRIFGENRVQELFDKASVMAGNIEWHLIGHLQTNKVRAVLPFVACIQSLDRLGLWQKIQEEAFKIDEKVPCLLQIKIATEETKFGWAFGELEELLQNQTHLLFPNVLISGVMGMASFSSEMDQVRKEMKQLKTNFDHLQSYYFKNDPAFNTISMGMSGDYQIALEEGSTMIRVGSLLFPSDKL